MKNSVFKIVLSVFVVCTSCTEEELPPILNIDPPEIVVDKNEINDPPNAFDLIALPNDSKSTNLTQVVFSWEEASDTDGDLVTYDVYFGTDIDEVDIPLETTTNTSFVFTDRFNVCTTYQWKVIAKDGKGGISESKSTFSFTTRSISIGAQALVEDASFADRAGHASVVFQNRLWVIGGTLPGVYKHGNDVYSSADGTNWEEMTDDSGFEGRRGHASVVFKDMIWVFGGQSSSASGEVFHVDVWNTKNGWNWNLVSSQPKFSGFYDYNVVVFNDELWVFGGHSIALTNGARQPNYKSWSSRDGISWEEHSPPIYNAAGGKGSTLVFNNAIWFLSDGGTAMRSTDGINWTVETTPSSSYGEAIWHDSLVFDDQMWIIAGQVYPQGAPSSQGSNTIWKSSNGQTWQQVPTTNGFPDRSLHTALTKDDKIFVIAGQAPTLASDVWVMD